MLTKALYPKLPRLHLDFRLRETSLGLSLTDDLQIHLLQLSQLDVTANNVYNAPLIEQWAYFLRNAEHLTRADVAQMFPDPEFAAAAGVLEMISQTPEERIFYDARVKSQRDEAARMEYALDTGLEQGREQGREEGTVIGKLVGRITTIQEFLGMPESSLADMSLSELTALADQLQCQLRERKHGV